MRVLIINKFLYPNGGSETYIFKLGEALEQHGHEVQYFGMEHEGRCVGNRVNAYTSGMDFHGGSKLSKLTYPIKTIYSKEARVQLRKVLDDFKPDVCHLNNFNYQLTPSIILEIVKWRKETGRDCKIIFTAHDYQLVCPNHMQMFLRNYCLRPSCYECIAKEVKTSDLTIADFWGINNVVPEMNDGAGASLVLVRTNKGKSIFESIKMDVELKAVTYEESVKNNSAEFKSCDDTGSCQCGRQQHCA